MKIKYYLYAITSAVLTFLLSAVISLPLLSLFSLVPFLHSLNQSKSFKSYLKISALFFFTYYFLGVSFLLELYKLIDLPFPVGILLSVLASVLVSGISCIIHIIPTAVIYRFSKHRITDAVCYAFMFTLGEYLISVIPLIGFPILTISLSFCEAPVFIQSAGLLGSFFITFIIVTVNSLFACIISTRIVSLKSLTSAALIVLIFSINAIYGVIRINKSDYFNDAVSVSVVQTDTRGLSKISNKSSSPLGDLTGFLDKSDSADMIFLPETAITYDLQNEDVTKEINSLLKRSNAEILSGIFYSADQKSYNAYCAFTSGKNEIYLKTALVPLGEFSFFSDKLFDGTNSLSPAESISPLKAETAAVAVGVCIESIYPSIIRSQVKDGGEIIAVPTNDSWFYGTHLQRLHFRHSVLRSVENFRYTVRSANSGISAVISPLGQVVTSLGEGEQGVISADVSRLQKKTLYTRFGNLWMILPIGLFFVILFFNLKQTGRIRLFKLDF